MKLLNYFGSFLDKTVNLNRTRLDQLQQRTDAISRALKSDDSIGERVLSLEPQGSWTHRTIIKPLNNHEFDADVLVRMQEDEDWTPQEYLRSVRAGLRRSATYREKVRKKNRSVRVGYANDCHIDLVPFIELSDGRQVIVNYRDDQFEDTNPEGFTSWMQERDELANHNLRKVLRLLKYLRDYKQTFSAPSIILTLLVGERITSWNTGERYKDVPTTLRTVLADLDVWLSFYPTMPVLEDPSAAGTTFNHRWTDAQYDNFRTKIALYSSWVTEAYDEPDREKSLRAWQRVFGDAFDTPTAPAATDVSTRAVEAWAERAPDERFIEELNFRLGLTYRATITATVTRKSGFRHGPPPLVAHRWQGTRARI